MSRYQGLTDAFIERLNAAMSKLGADTYVPVDPIVFADLHACLDAWRDRRPFSTRPRTAFDHEYRPPPPPRTEPEDVMSPGARLADQMEELRKR
jgi:hypothetical protein